jgi:hypothetical protein
LIDSINICKSYRVWDSNSLRSLCIFFCFRIHFVVNQ